MLDQPNHSSTLRTKFTPPPNIFQIHMTYSLATNQDLGFPVISIVHHCSSQGKLLCELVFKVGCTPLDSIFNYTSVKGNSWIGSAAKIWEFMIPSFRNWDCIQKKQTQNFPKQIMCFHIPLLLLQNPVNAGLLPRAGKSCWEREGEGEWVYGKGCTCSDSSPLAKRYGEQRMPTWSLYVPWAQRNWLLVSLLELQVPNGMLTQGNTKKKRARIQ